MPMGKSNHKHGPLKYHQVKSRLERTMAELAPGDRLPPERRLAEKMECSVLTVRNALALLVGEGRVTRSRGRGTFLGSGMPNTPPARSRRTRTLGVLIHTASDAYALRLNGILTKEALRQRVSLRLRVVADLDDGALAQVDSLAEDGCGAAITAVDAEAPVEPSQTVAS